MCQAQPCHEVERGGLMLVLSRREHERIRLGDSVVVTVVKIAGDRVRLGIEAPPHVPILRDELNPSPPSDPTLDPAPPRPS
jgi:carbon storage regulator